MDRRERLIAVFEDTQAYYTENAARFSQIILSEKMQLGRIKPQVTLQSR